MGVFATPILGNNDDLDTVEPYQGIKPVDSLGLCQYNLCFIRFDWLYPKLD